MHTNIIILLVGLAFFAACKPSPEAGNSEVQSTKPSGKLLNQAKNFEGSGKYSCEGLIKYGNSEFGTIVTGNFGSTGNPEFDGIVTTVSVVIFDAKTSKTIHTETLPFSNTAFVSPDSGMMVAFGPKAEGSIARVTTGAKQTNGVVHTAAKPTKPCRAVSGSFLKADGAKGKFQSISPDKVDTYFCQLKSPNKAGLTYLIELGTKSKDDEVRKKIKGLDTTPQITVKGNSETYGPFKLDYRSRLLGIGKKHWYRLPSFPKVSFDILPNGISTASIVHVISGKEQRIIPATLDCKKTSMPESKKIYDDFFSFTKQAEKPSAESVPEEAKNAESLTCSFKCQASSNSNTTLSKEFSRTGERCLLGLDNKLIKNGDLSKVVEQDYKILYSEWCKKKVYAETKDSSGKVRQAVSAVEISITNN